MEPGVSENQQVHQGLFRIFSEWKSPTWSWRNCLVGGITVFNGLDGNDLEGRCTGAYPRTVGLLRSHIS